MSRSPAASRPLSELERRDWSSLEDAYGPAPGTPELLQRLAAGDEHAGSDVCSFLWHQGTVYSATAYAVPFIVGLVEQERGDLLHLLSLMADGHGDHLVHERNPLRRNSPEMQAIMQREQEWIDAARRAIQRGADVYRLYLMSSNADIRAKAVKLLTLCDTDSV